MIFQKSYNMKIESSEFEHRRAYLKQFGAERVNIKNVLYLEQLNKDDLLRAAFESVYE